MSEAVPQPDPTVIDKPLDAVPEEIQFNDRAVAFGWRTKGDSIDLTRHKYSSHLDSYSGIDAAIVSLASGRRFALGTGVSVMLPEFSKETGRYHVQSDHHAAALKDIAPDGLPPVVIGEPWAIIDASDPVTDIVVDYKTDGSIRENAHQVESPSPFPDAREILREVVEKMQATGHIQ